MRSDQDPFWAAGKGFGPVRNSLRLYPQPWERGQFSFLSGGTDTLDHSLSELLRLPEPVPLPRVAEGPAQAACASAQSAGAAQSFAPPKAKGGGAWSTAEEKRQRLQALCKWSNLLRLAPKLFSERTLASLPDTGDQAVAEHLDLLFSRKSTNTLLLRVQPLMRLCSGLGVLAQTSRPVNSWSGYTAAGCRPPLRPAASTCLSAACILCTALWDWECPLLTCCRQGFVV